jgi:signal transduction histidine kinase
MATLPLNPAAGSGNYELADSLPEAQEFSGRTRAFVWLTLAFWLSNFLLMTLGTVLSGNEHLAGITGMRALVTLFGLMLCYMIHYLLTRPSLSSFRKRVIVLALLAPVTAEVFAWASFFGDLAADPSIGFHFTWPAAIRTISFWTWFFLAWAGLYLALSYSFDVRQEQERANELQALAHAAKLRALHNQVNPHFLFNSLNSVSALILDRRIEQADRMVTKLAQFFRMGLAIDPMVTIPLSQEIALQRAYLEIEQLRYPDLVVGIVLPKALENAEVPSLILQPVVENAVKYGVAGSAPPTEISIVATRDGGRLILEVSDTGRSGTKTVKPGSGIGLVNVRQRLQLLYGDDQSMTAGRRPEGGFQVRIALPVGTEA